ncbi:MAG: hypothetical protein ACI8QD_001150 [Cyclobacteriaceae bacterium]|jgi:hypothetical protein
MNLESQHKILATIHLVRGVLLLILLAIGKIVFSLMYPFVMQSLPEGDVFAKTVLLWLLDAANWIVWLVFLITIAPSIVGAIALVQKKEWGLTLLLISGCFSLLSFPIGTALGVYTLWVFFKTNESR